MTQNNSNPIATGIASYGMSGQVFHAPFINLDPRFRLNKVVERHSDKAKAKYPEVEVVKSFDALLQDEEIELVVVNTPNALHFEMAQQALLAGKHVVLEKPFTPTTQEAQELIDLAKKQSRLLTVYQNRRWDGDFLTLQQIAEQKLLGQIVYFEAHYDRFRNYIVPNSWKESGETGTGLLYDLGIHLIDQALVLFGQPHSITANIGKQRPGTQVNDYYHITLHYEGLTAILTSSYLVRELGPRYILHGTEGSFVKYGIDPQEEALKAGQMPTGPDWGKEQATDWGKLSSQVNGLHVTGNIETIPGSYVNFYNNVYEAIREGKELAVKPEEALLGIRIIELALQSSAEKRTIAL